jgi:hypothetical protein
MARLSNKKMSDVDGSDEKGPNRRERRQILNKQIKDSGMPGPRVAYKMYGPGILSLEKKIENSKEKANKALESIKNSKENPSKESLSKAQEDSKSAIQASDDAVKAGDQVIQYEKSSNKEQRQSRREYKRNIQFPEGSEGVWKDTPESLKADRRAGREERRAGREEGRDAKRQERTDARDAQFNERQARRDERNNITEEDKPKIGEKITSAINSVKNALTGGTVAANESGDAQPTNIQLPSKQVQEEGQALNQQVNNSLPSSGAALVDAVNKNGTFEEQQQAVKDAKDLNEEEIAQKNIVVANAENNVQAIDDAPSKDVVVEDNAPSTTNVSPVQTETSNLPGGGGTAAQVVGSPYGAAPSYAGAVTKTTVAKDVVNNAVSAVDSIPGLVLDKLRPEDYYPNISKDIAVGTFSGKYLGSSTIFAAPGARLPMGLYDARKRALVEQAKAKQAEIDKLLAIPETDALYQAQFSESFLDGAYGFMQKHNFNTTSLKRDPEAIKFFARYQAKAREITAATTFADSVIKKSQDANSYVPKSMRNTAYDVKNNLLNRTPDILAGNESAIKPIQDAKIYNSLAPEVEKIAARIFDPNNLSQTPINLNTGEKYNGETYIKERNQFLSSVNDMNTNTDTYVTGVLKYFGGSIDGILNGLFEANPNANEEQKQALREYLASQVPKQEILKYTTNQNANQWQANLNERRRQFDTEQKNKENNWWGGANDINNDAINGNTGKSYNQELAELQNKRLSGAELDAEMKRLAQVYQVGTEAYYSPTTNSWVSYVPASPEKRKQGAELTRTNNGYDPTMWVSVEIYDFKTNKWVARNIPVDQMGAVLSKNTNYDDNGNKRISVRDAKTQKRFTASDRQGYADQKSGSTWTKPEGYEIRKGHINNFGDFVPLEADGSTLSEYNASNSKKTYVVPTLKMFSRKEVPNPETMQMMQQDVELSGNAYGEAVDINSPQGQAYMNNQSGYSIGKSAESARVGETNWNEGTSGGTYNETHSVNSPD